MAEKKADQSGNGKAVEKPGAAEPEKKTETGKPSQTKPSQTKPSQAKTKTTKSPSTAGLKATTAKVTEKAKQVAEKAANGATKVGKAAQELSEGLQKKVENDIAPAAQRAKKNLSETSKKMREELAPATEKAKKVAEDLKPAAEKAGKGLSAVFKATARATRKSARILGIKASISAALRRRQKLFAQLGENYFRVQKKKTPSKGDQEELKSLVAAIEAVNSDIRSLEAEEKLARESS